MNKEDENCVGEPGDVCTRCDTGFALIGEMKCEMGPMVSHGFKERFALLIGRSNTQNVWVQGAFTTCKTDPSSLVPAVPCTRTSTGSLLIAA